MPETGILNYSIRSAQLRDTPGLARIQVDSYRRAYAPFFPPAYIEHFTYAEQEQDWYDLLANGSSEVLLVACTPDQEIIGYTLARLSEDCYPGYASEIAALHVQHGLQGQGVGGSLLRAAAMALQASGASSAMLWTLQSNPVRTWYERLGGRYLGEKRFMVDDWEVVEVAYGWPVIGQLAGGSGAPAPR